jgi:hypothetical protein
MLRAFASTNAPLRHLRQTIILAWLAALSVALVVYAYYGLHNDFWVALALSLGTNLMIVLSTYLVFNPLVEQVRTATTREHNRLDHDAFIDRVAASRSTVCILSTWTFLLEDPYRQRFLAAVRTALSRRVSVQILLLDPMSKGAESRGEELHWRRESVSALIIASLRHLEQFRNDAINDRMRQHLQVRIYSASPSVMYYRWDNKAYISFFAIGRMAENAPKLETFMTTPWADFVRDRFEELWNHPTTATLDRYLHAGLLVRDRAGKESDFQVEYISLDGEHYVASPGLTQLAIRHGITNLTARFNEPPHSATDATSTDYTLTVVDESPGRLQSIITMFKDKYAHAPSDVLCLAALTRGDGD